MEVTSISSLFMSTLKMQFTDWQLILLVLTGIFVAVGFLSYFVIAPEFEKQMELGHAAMLIRHRQARNMSSYYLQNRQSMRESNACLSTVSESNFEDDLSERNRRSSHSDESHYCSLSAKQYTKPRTTSARVAPMVLSEVKSSRTSLRANSMPVNCRSVVKDIELVTGRRSSTSPTQADVMRRRVLLRRLEEEIDNEMLQHSSKKSSIISRRSSGTSLMVSNDRLRMLASHPVDCSEELQKLLLPQEPHELTKLLRIVHDVLSYYLSQPHHDMNKVTVICNSLIKFDTLNQLKNFQASDHVEIRQLASSIIEKAVPAIWH